MDVLFDTIDMDPDPVIEIIDDPVTQTIYWYDPEPDNSTLITTNYRPYSNKTCPVADITFNFVVNAVVVGSLCLCGLVGNSLSIFVLQKDPHNKVAIFLLQWLAVADNLLLVVSFTTLSIWKGFLPFVHTDEGSLRSSMVYIPTVINPLGAMTQTAMVWITVLLALNRYLAVCKPFQAVKLCTLKKAKIQVFSVVAFAVCFNIPGFFQYKIMEIVLARETDHGVVNVTQLTLQHTHLGVNRTFGIVYTNALYTILIVILPLVLLCVLNTQIIRELRKSREHRASTGGLPSPSDDNISFIMIIIVVVFIVCQTPDRVLQIFSVLIFSRHNCSLTKERLICVCNLLVIVNSSINFVIYYVFRSSFRKILKRRVCFVPTRTQRSDTWEKSTHATKIELAPVIVIADDPSNGHIGNQRE